MKGAGDEKERAESYLQVRELPEGWAGSWSWVWGEASVTGTSDGLETPILGMQ